MRRFESTNYGEHSIVNESYAHATLFKPDEGPVWQIHTLQENRLEDESELINFGVPEESTFISVLEPDELKPSRMNKFPENYKFISFNIHVSWQRLVIGRETYGLLDFFGDVGGLFDFFCQVGKLVFSRTASLKMYTIIATGFYSWTHDNSEHKGPKQGVSYSEEKSIPPASNSFHIWNFFFGSDCCKRCYFRKYSRAINLV
jgi:hypothetical protein